VCPRGNARAGGGFTWSGGYAIAAPRLEDALARADAVAPSMLAREDGTLIGFSIGASVALSVAIAQPGRWTGLVLMSMQLAIDPAKLRASGVRRVVLAAADDDGARASLVRAADTLARSGVSARFVSLGRVGHHFARDMDAIMADAVAWVRAND
jgi:predicted esterase